MTAQQRLVLIGAGIAFLLLMAAWTAVRLRRSGALRRLHDERQAEDLLRAQAEAVLAARVARGELDRAAYERLVERLWGPPPAPAESAADAPPAPAPPPAPPAPPGTSPAPRALGVRAAAAGTATPPGGGRVPPAPPAVR